MLSNLIANNVRSARHAFTVSDSDMLNDVIKSSSANSTTPCRPLDRNSTGYFSHDDSGFCTDILSSSDEHSIVSLDAEL